VVSVRPWSLFTPGKDPVPIVQEAGWAPGPVWTGAENLALTGIRSRDRPACSQSLYRLSYRAHSVKGNLIYLIPLCHIHYNTKTASKLRFIIFIYLCFGIYIDHNQVTKHTIFRRQFKMQSTRYHVFVWDPTVLQKFGFTVKS